MSNRTRADSLSTYCDLLLSPAGLGCGALGGPGAADHQLLGAAEGAALVASRPSAHAAGGFANVVDPQLCDPLDGTHGDGKLSPHLSPSLLAHAAFLRDVSPLVKPLDAPSGAGSVPEPTFVRTVVGPDHGGGGVCVCVRPLHRSASGHGPACKRRHGRARAVVPVWDLPGAWYTVWVGLVACGRPGMHPRTWCPRRVQIPAGATLLGHAAGVVSPGVQSRVEPSGSTPTRACTVAGDAPRQRSESAGSHTDVSVGGHRCAGRASLVRDVAPALVNQ